jgi:hypothetical protein
LHWIGVIARVYVTPAEAGVQDDDSKPGFRLAFTPVPAFAGMNFSRGWMTSTPGLTIRP